VASAIVLDDNAPSGTARLRDHTCSLCLRSRPCFNPVTHGVSRYLVLRLTLESRRYFIGYFYSSYENNVPASSPLTKRSIYENPSIVINFLSEQTRAHLLSTDNVLRKNATEAVHTFNMT